jgi:hypothetical protein
MSSPTLAAATTLPLTISINEVNGASETLLTTVTGLNARLDVRTQRYVIDGDPFNTLATNLITAATNRFALTPPTSGATSRWLLRASFGSAGTLVEPVLGAMVLDVTFRQIP